MAGSWHRFAKIKQTKNPLDKGGHVSREWEPAANGGEGNMRKIALQEEKWTETPRDQTLTVHGDRANAASRMLHWQEKGWKRKELDSYQQHAEEEDT